MKNLFLLTAGLIPFMLSTCKMDQSKKIVGSWKAYWEAKINDLSDVKAENLKMEGDIQFFKDGRVEISAYGYEGCIFSYDTLKNILNWKLDDNTLKLIDGDDNQGLAYSIVDFSNDHMKLSLLDDINLTLVKKGD